MGAYRRALCIVLDGAGCGAAPDAGRWGDTAANTIGNTARAVGGLRAPILETLGLGNIADISGVSPSEAPGASWGRMHPQATGKDSTAGHWELMGCVIQQPLPIFPDGFPEEIIARFERAIGRGIIGNRAESGTRILELFGGEHLRTGRPIVYTSADSVFQVAAHDSVASTDTLYGWCACARELLRPPFGVGRVIARPFTGYPGQFIRKPQRRDFSIAPPGPTVLDRLSESGRGVLAIGKTGRLFAGRGVDRSVPTEDNAEGMARTLEWVHGGRDESFAFVNLVDFDTMWGHRNDPRAWALGFEEFDSFLADLLPALSPGDLLVLTADHGTDPTTPGTDHTRESVPLLVWHCEGSPGTFLGSRPTFADVGATIADALGAGWPAGESLLDLIRPPKN